MIPDVPFEIMFDITPEDTTSEDLTPPAPLPYKGMGEPDSNSPLLAGEGLGERSTEE
jgi:primosomal protein N' (replication factor Y)